MAAMAHCVPLFVDSAKRDLGSVIQWGRQKMADGAYDAAVQHFTVALDLKPGLMHALVSRGCCHLTLGDAERAQRDFAEVISKDAGFNRNIYVLIALCLKRLGDYHKAIRYLSRCLAQFASFKPALIARGELSLKVREFDKARVDFRLVLNTTPQDIVARRGLADALRGLGQLREALRHYTRAIEDATQLLQQRRLGASEDDDDLDRTRSAQSEETDDEAATPVFHRAGQAAGRSEFAPYDVEGDLDGFTRRSEDGPSGADFDAAPDSLALRQALGSLADPEQVRSFLADALLRRALLLRLMGDLEAAGESLLEALQLNFDDGLALFWYGKLLIEQGRHKEAPGFLQTSIQHHEATRPYAHALLGALLMTWQEPDLDAALRHLREAARLQPSSQSVRVTLWICQAMGALRQAPRDPGYALQFLDRALAALLPPKPPPGAAAAATIGVAPGGRASPRLPGGQTPRAHVAGSGGAAAAALAFGLAGRSPEETRWTTTKAIEKRRQELAQGSDLELAMDCATYLQLVAEDPQQRLSEVPFLLYALRTLALCDLGLWEDAVSDCRKALAIDPRDQAAQYTFNIASGILRVRCGKYDAAVGCFSKAINLQPVSAEARIHRAIALARAAQHNPVVVGAAGGAAAGGSIAGTSMATSGAGSSAGGDRSGASVAGSNASNAARVTQLLEEAVQDLEAVEQQAQISGRPAPIGAWHLRAACLCSLGRPQDAHDVLQQCRELGHGSPEALARHKALEAEVLMLLHEYSDAIEACSALIAATPPGAPTHIEARLLRGCCYSELQEADRAFEDYREALVLAPERPDVHEASGELFLLHCCFQEAVTAFTTAAKLTEALSPRLSYKRGLAHLALGNAGAALKDMVRASRINPTTPLAARARDGLAALQSAIDGDFRHAHVRLNVLLHAPLPVSSDRLPVLLLPFELAVYRGVCSLYLGEAEAASQDFGIAADLAAQDFECLGLDFVESQFRSVGSKGTSQQLQPSVSRLHPDVSSQRGLACFNCEALYNVVLCQLMLRQYRAALATCQQLLARESALHDIGEHAPCLIHFLVGVCYLALGESADKAARDAFTKSYAFDPRYVDDFLRRHSRRGEPIAGGGFGAADAVATTMPRQRVGAPPPMGGAVRPHAVPASCDAVPEAVCCLRPEKLRFSSRLPPLRIVVRDVVIWARPSAAWPAVLPCGPAPPQGLARLDLLQQHEAMPPS